MTQPSTKTRLSHQEYLTLEQSSEVKHEYLDGKIYAMSGGTPAHALAAANISRLLGVLLVGQPCAVFSSDLSVYVEQTDLATYPDVTVVCGPVRGTSLLSNAVTNPRLIVEVLSPSTEGYDRGAKFSHYKRISTFSEYLLVATDRIHIDHFRRTESGVWAATECSGMDAVVRLASIAGDIALSEVYAKLDLVTAGQADEPSPRPPGVGYRKKGALGSPN